MVRMNDPIITITVLDEQSARQDELRELYLKWISENEVRNKDATDEMRLSPSRRNVTPGW